MKRKKLQVTEIRQKNNQDSTVILSDGSELDLLLSVESRAALNDASTFVIKGYIGNGNV